MIERLLIAWLTPRLPGVRVASRVPNPRPEQLVRVEAAGGTRQNLAQDRPMAIVQAWALADADLLMAQVRDLLLAGLPGAAVTVPTREGFERIQVYSVTEVGGATNFPDPDTEMPRYQMTVEIRLSH